MRAQLPVVLTFTLSAGLGAPACAESRLSPADARHLDSLMKDFLFDPVRAERVRIKYEAPRNLVYRWPTDEETTRDGWLIKGKWGTPGRIHFTDGFAIAAPPPGQIRRLNFVKQAEQFFSARQPPDADTMEWIQKTAREAFGDPESFPPWSSSVLKLGDSRYAASFLTMAVWLRRLGHDQYAAEALDLARAFSEDPQKDLRQGLARDSFDCLLDAFCSGADDRALAYGEHFLRVHAATDEKKKGQVAAIAADLKRRRKVGTFGKPAPTELPRGYESWDLSRKIGYLIESLDQCRPDPNSGNSGAVDFFADFRVVALISLGEPAVPALLDVIETDARLTRVPELGSRHQFHVPTGDMVGVREPAATVVQSILKMHRFPPAPGEDPAAGWEAIWPARIRHYWKAYGAIPFDERMMGHLKDKAADEGLWRQVAENLALWDVDRSFSRYGAYAVKPNGWKKKPNPAVTKFTDPTMAEAIVAAIDRDRAIQIGRGPNNGAFHCWPETEAKYLENLVDLGDPRIGPELGQRAAAAGDLDVRRKYAFAALRLGESAAWKDFAADIERGTLRLRSAVTESTHYAGRSREEVELGMVVRDLVRSATPEGERALRALTNPKHPYHSVVQEGLRTGRVDVWSSHPFCIPVLRADLTDEEPTGGRFELRGTDVIGPTEGCRSGVNGSEEWADASQFHPEAGERVCDRAALRVSETFVGGPFFHPLCKDADDRLAQIVRFLDLHKGRFRLMTLEECDRLYVSFRDHVFIPDIKPLGRPATAADVKSGLAVFHLDGKGRVWTGPIPQKVVLKSDAKKKYPPAGLVVQAEADANGKPVFGVVFRYEIRAVRGDEIAP